MSHCDMVHDGGRVLCRGVEISPLGSSLGRDDGIECFRCYSQWH